MTKIPEDRRKKLAELYATSFVLYRASAGDQSDVFYRWADRAEDEPDPHGFMELLATDIGGYVSTLIDDGEVDEPVNALEHLRRMPVLEHPEIAPFCRDHGAEYPDLVRYMEMLETCRREAMAILEAVLDSGSGARRAGA
ncbi:hypothetical protein [Nannocystis radixulma]|uniref:DUF4375 domain-containing protein n=1 Tax=Nannocystis radixulma TaxID=2995305 RepID=A0ABT5AZ65_9BACT|nr:hypothetical protein [Nannocystis radixulma]MDC0667129.1 hypothetical protein [Nannocystis radixulma]